jgi:hypothetical protein
MPKDNGLPATAGILRSAVAAFSKTADALGDLGDEEAALILDACTCRTKEILAARIGPPPTSDLIAAAAVSLRTLAETLHDRGDHEAETVFGQAAEGMAAILDARTPRPALAEMRRELRRQKGRERAATLGGRRFRRNAKKRDQVKGQSLS